MYIDINKDRNKKCKRCGRTGLLLSNGLCARCDNVIYGKK